MSAQKHELVSSLLASQGIFSEPANKLEINTLIFSDDQQAKSKLTQNLSGNKSLNLTGFEMNKLTFRIANTDVTTKVWDYVAQERFNALPAHIVRNLAAIVFVVDLAKPDTLGFIGRILKNSSTQFPEKTVKTLVAFNYAQASPDIQVCFDKACAVSKFDTVYLPSEQDLSNNKSSEKPQQNFSDENQEFGMHIFMRVSQLALERYAPPKAVVPTPENGNPSTDVVPAGNSSVSCSVM